MAETNREVWKRIIIFLLINFGLSTIFNYLIISSGSFRTGRGLFVLGVMWCPGIAALITCKLCGKSISELGWGWGKTKYQIASYLIPFGYALVAYLAIWLSGLGGFYNPEFVQSAARDFRWEGLPAGLVLFLTVLATGTLGIIRSTGSALGEEIGWRGFLVPELAKVTSFTNTAIISGAVWAVWHYPALLFADYNAGTPAWYGLSCFTVMVIAMSFIFAWMRLVSGSLWTAAFLHGSHNLFVQAIFTPLTADTGKTKYFIDEFGAALAIVSIIVGYIFWRKRQELPKTEPPAAA
ncbi:MAG: CPBP family intramembrane metalloprotease [candidate division Zixibacteria bacterium]|nr:CPBP family intramembrane metalloprotease [candidate division Zixibacteria bacterium]MCI0596515.1 CPBP family intramembrane metalloprotease [candidate division Zixibacteria bacterium]